MGSAGTLSIANRSASTGRGFEVAAGKQTISDGGSTSLIPREDVW